MMGGGRTIIQHCGPNNRLYARGGCEQYMLNMATFWISCILLLLIQNAASKFDSSVCTLLKESCGLIPPPLPTNFEMKGESVNFVNNSTIYEEIYFDYSNNRVKYMILNSSVEHHVLFDFETSQVIEWDILHPGIDIKRDLLSQECSATEMEESPGAYTFGFTAYPRFKMANANQALRYGGQYVYAANGTKKLDDRGLLVNHFIGCIYDSSIDASLKMRYSFTHDKVEPAGATYTEDVTGFQDGFLSVPAMIKVEGAVPAEGNEVKRLNFSQSISWFKAEPEFAMGTFQIPPWIYCTDYRGRKEMPKFPTAFSTRLTITQFQLDVMGDMGPAEVGIDESEDYEIIFYYGEKNLARRDFTPSPFRNGEIFSKFQSYTPVSTVYDFNQGLRYTINKPTGRCYIKPIGTNDNFVDRKFSLGIKMAAPEDVFMMETDEMEYKGKAFTRDIECDVWTGKLHDEESNTTFVKETYISTNGWHEDVDEMVEYGIPVKHLVIDKTLNDNLMEGVAVYNFLKFKAKSPRLALFDINNCVEYVNHEQYAIVLDVNKDTKELITKSRFNFLETAQYYLADMTEVLTPLRIQRLQLLQRTPPGGKNSLSFLVFTLLDKPEFKELVEVTGADLKAAVVNLQKVVDRGGFSISFYPQGSKEPISVNAKPGNLYIIKPNGTLRMEPLRKTVASKWRNDLGAGLFIQRAEEEESEVVEEKGMTSGNLALLAIAMLFIGIGIGIAIMYLYVRMYDERKVEDRINLTVSKDAVETSLEEAAATNESSQSDKY